MSFSAAISIFGVNIIVWVLIVAHIVVFAGVAVVFVTVVGGDVVVQQRVSGLERRGWGVCWGVVG